MVEEIEIVQEPQEKSRFQLHGCVDVVEKCRADGFAEVKPVRQAINRTSLVALPQILTELLVWPWRNRGLEPLDQVVVVHGIEV